MRINFNGGSMLKITVLSILLASCSMYELREGEYEINEPESLFIEEDEFDKFMDRGKDHD